MSQEFRARIMQQTDEISQKPRFGLFSQLASTAVGESNLYKPSKSRLDSNNKPIVEPKNIMTSPNKSGQLNKSYFGPLNTLANFTVHDVYIDEGRRLVKEQKEVFEKGKVHELPFIPLSGIKTLSGPSYAWMKTKTEPDNPRKFRNSQGAVIVEPRGFYTNCQSNVVKRLNQFPKHITDPYDSQQQIEKQRRKLNKSKQGEVSFKTGNYPPKLLSDNRQIYGIDFEIKQVDLRVMQKKQRSFSQSHVYKHESVFKSSNPPKSGLAGFLAPFPEYMPNPPPVKSKCPGGKDGEERKVFKSMSIEKSQPCPSVTSNPINMKRYISHSFNKRF